MRISTSAIGDEIALMVKKMYENVLHHILMTSWLKIEIADLCMKQRLYKQGKMGGKWMGLWQVATLASILQHR